MTIWVGHDGTLNDDEGDGPAVTGDPMMYVRTDGQTYVGADGQAYVGDMDWGSALGSLGSAAASAFGGSGGGGGGGGFGGSGGGGGGFDFSSLSNGSDTGSAIANIFGQVAKAAVPLATQAISQATQQHPSQQPPAGGSQGSQMSTQQPPAGGSQGSQTPAQAATRAQATKPGAARGKSSTSPKDRLLLLLAHWAKDYNMPPPDKSAGGHVGDFMNDMMKGPGSTAKSGSGSATKTSGLFDVDVDASPLDRIVSSIGRLFSFGRPSYSRRGYSMPGVHFHVPSLPMPQIYGYGGQGYGGQQQHYAQPSVTYQPYAMPSIQTQAQAAPLRPRTVQVTATAPRRGGSSHGVADESVREVQRLLNEYWHSIGFGESRTGIQSTSMYSPQSYYTDSYGAYVLPYESPFESWTDEQGSEWMAPWW